MLPYVYILTSVAVVIAIIRKPNPVTFTSVYGLGTIIYGAPLYLGFTVFVIDRQRGFKPYYAELDWRIYAMFFAAQAVFFIASRYERPKKARPACKPSPHILTAMNIVLIVSFLKFLEGLGPVMMLPKAERMDAITLSYYVTSIIAVAMMILYALSRGGMSRKHLIIPMIFAALDLAIGFRSMFLALAAVAVAYCESRDMIFTAKSKAKVIALGLLVIVAAFVYKPVQGAISGGYFNIGNMEQYLKTSFIGSEPFAIAGVLNEVIITHPKLPDGYFTRSVMQYIPFYMEITNGGWSKFNDVCQSRFPEARWGIASTSFGELFTVGGWFAIIIFLLVQLLCLWGRPLSQPYLAVLHYYVGPYLFIYFYRNDWHFVLGTIRQCVLTAAIVALVYVSLAAVRYARQIRLGAEMGWSE